ncbi:MAG: ribosomal RNA small subunit methyltransferase A [Candidatus Moranbacteria bacterium]|nr:ribosomal RNA small subunit methyltransferase A [Candidatus Moranbacteria bacterium]
MPKKHLGQNFLRDEAVLQRIIESSSLSTDDLVLEIGPGEGVLTERLAEHAKKVIAIEIDGDLIGNLRDKFKDDPSVRIINKDILKMNLPEFIAKEFKDGKYKLIANIPYYITSPIIRLFLETKLPPTEMILMVQKEVAERIVAKPGSMSILAVSVQYYAQAELLFDVDAESFYPIPEVDSAVIRIKPEARSRNRDEAKKFFRVVKAGFSSKRKTLSNNLSSSFCLNKKEVDEKLKSAGLSPIQRAQELNIEDWERLASIF